VSKVTNMGTMFFYAKAFSKTLCGAWQKSTANKDRMFSGSSGKITSMCTTPKVLYQQTKEYNSEVSDQDKNKAQTTPAFSLGSGDFVIYTKVTPYDPRGGHGGTILARHKQSTPKGWFLTLTKSLHVILGIWSGATGYYSNSDTPRKPPACVKDTVDFNGMWARGLMSAYALKKGKEATLAIVRKGKTLTLYVDGVLSCTAAVSSFTDDYTGVGITLGGHYTSGGRLEAAPLKGRIRDTRVQKGHAYTPGA